MKPRIFISHSGKDHDFGTRLVNDLRRELDDKTAVWYDSLEGLYGGDEWWNTIMKEIRSRPIFIVILSPDAMQSRWVNTEITIAWRQRLSSKEPGKLIIPILYRSCKIRDDINTIQYINFLEDERYERAFGELVHVIMTYTALHSRKLEHVEKGIDPPTKSALEVNTAQQKYIDQRKNPFFLKNRYLHHATRKKGMNKIIMILSYFLTISSVIAVSFIATRSTYQITNPHPTPTWTIFSASSPPLNKTYINCGGIRHPNKLFIDSLPKDGYKGSRGLSANENCDGWYSAAKATTDLRAGSIFPSQKIGTTLYLWVYIPPVAEAMAEYNVTCNNNDYYSFSPFSQRGRSGWYNLGPFTVTVECSELNITLRNAETEDALLAINAIGVQL